MVGMDNSYPSKLHIWDEWSTGIAADAVVSECPIPLAGPHHPTEFAERLYRWEALDPAAPSPRPDEATQPAKARAPLMIWIRSLLVCSSGCSLRCSGLIADHGNEQVCNSRCAHLVMLH